MAYYISISLTLVTLVRLDLFQSFKSYKAHNLATKKGYNMTNKQILFLLFKDMTTKQIDKYNLDHNLVGINKLTKQQIKSWNK